VIKIDENCKITIKPQLIGRMSTKLEWGEGSSSTSEELKENDTISMTSQMSRMSFELVMHSVG